MSYMIEIHMGISLLKMEHIIWSQVLNWVLDSQSHITFGTMEWKFHIFKMAEIGYHDGVAVESQLNFLNNPKLC